MTSTTDSARPTDTARPHTPDSTNSPEGTSDVASASAGTNATLRIGLVGAGGVAARHARALRGFADVQVVGVTDPVPDRAGEVAGACGAAVAPDLAALLDLGVDAAYVCVPPFAHGAPERALVEAGVPFFVEKPLGVDIAPAEEIAAGVAERDLVTATGYHWRYYDTVELARDLLAATPARLAVGAWLDKVPPPAWWVRRDRSGGPLVEQVTHLVDLMRVLLGEVSAVHAVGARFPRAADAGEAGNADAGPDSSPAASDVDDVTAATLRFRTGAVGSLVSTSLLTWKHRAAVEVYADGLALRLGEDALLVDRGGQSERIYARVDARTAADRAFVDAVRSGDPSGVRAPYAEALRSHRIACALAQAARDGGTVDLAAAHAPVADRG